MTIEVHQPELEALIRERMRSGAFQSIDELLMEALKPSRADAAPSHEEVHRQRLFDWLNQASGSGWNLDLHPELKEGAARWVESLRRDDEAIDSSVAPH